MGRGAESEEFVFDFDDVARFSVSTASTELADRPAELIASLDAYAEDLAAGTTTVTQLGEIANLAREELNYSSSAFLAHAVNHFNGGEDALRENATARLRALAYLPRSGSLSEEQFETLRAELLERCAAEFKWRFASQMSPLNSGTVLEETIQRETELVIAEMGFNAFLELEAEERFERIYGDSLLGAEIRASLGGAALQWPSKRALEQVFKLSSRQARPIDLRCYLQAQLAAFGWPKVVVAHIEASGVLEPDADPASFSEEEQLYLQAWTQHAKRIIAAVNHG